MAYIQQHPYFKELSKRAQRKVSSITKEKKTKRVVNPPKKITSKASEQNHTLELHAINPIPIKWYANQALALA